MIEYIKENDNIGLTDHHREHLSGIGQLAFNWNLHNSRQMFHLGEKSKIRSKYQVGHGHTNSETALLGRMTPKDLIAHNTHDERINFHLEQQRKYYYGDAVDAAKEVGVPRRPILDTLTLSQELARTAHQGGKNVKNPGMAKRFHAMLGESNMLKFSKFNSYLNEERANPDRVLQRLGFKMHLHATDAMVHAERIPGPAIPGIADKKYLSLHNSAQKLINSHPEGKEAGHEALRHGMNMAASLTPHFGQSNPRSPSVTGMRLNPDLTKHPSDTEGPWSPRGTSSTVSANRRATFARMHRTFS